MLHTVDPLIISLSPTIWISFFLLFLPRMYIIPVVISIFALHLINPRVNWTYSALRCYFNLYSAPPQEFYDITLENRSPLHNFIIPFLALYLLSICSNSPYTYTVDPSLPRNLMKPVFFVFLIPSNDKVIFHHWHKPSFSRRP